MKITIPNHSVLAVWYDNQIIAVIQNPTKELLETAVKRKDNLNGIPPLNKGQPLMYVQRKEVKPLWVLQEQWQNNGIFNQIIKNNKPIIMNELKLGAVTVNLFDTKKAQNVFRALNHKLRQQLMLAIEEGTGKATVTDLYVKLRLEQSVCSQHLAIIRKVGLVKATRDGKCIFYSINYQMLSVVNEVSVTLLKAAK